MTVPFSIAQPKVHLTDPHDCTDNSDTLSILHAVFDTLVRRQGRTHVPHVAARWNVSQGGRCFTFHLRGALTFHDGVALDAQAVCENLTRLARPDKGYTLGAPGVWHQYLGAARITPLDSLTVEIRLPEPVADLLDVLSQCFLVSPRCFEAFDEGRFDPYTGSGRYRVSGMTSGCVAAVANPDHFLPAPARPAIEWHGQASAQKRLEMLRNGDVAVANRVPYDTPSTPAFTVSTYLDPVAIIFLFNCRTGPLKDPVLRRALNMAIDRERLIKDVLGGAAVPLDGFVSAHHFGAPVAARPLYDPEQVRGLLQTSGYDGGLTLKVDCPTRLPDEAELLTVCLGQQLAGFGISLDITVHPDREAYAHRVRRKEIGDLCVFDSSPMSTFRVLYEKLDARSAGSWWQGYHNASVEALLDAGRTTSDDSSREALYQAAYFALRRDPPWLYLYNPLRALGGRLEAGVLEMAADGTLDVGQLEIGQLQGGP
jgi:peptide/nickel transport system substrate-binding protein